MHLTVYDNQNKQPTNQPNNLPNKKKKNLTYKIDNHGVYLES